MNSTFLVPGTGSKMLAMCSQTIVVAAGSPKTVQQTADMPPLHNPHRTDGALAAKFLARPMPERCGAGHVTAVDFFDFARVTFALEPRDFAGGVSGALGVLG